MAKLSQDDEERLKKIEEKIETMWLGIYGDSQNEIEGVIQTVREIKNKDRDRWKKIISFSVGASTIVAALVEVFKWIKH